MDDSIFTQYQVRKTNKEKNRFIEYLKDRLSQSGYDREKDIRVEEKWSGVFRTRNIIVGNPEQAKVIFTAHYDTCPVLPFPNVMTPTNPVLYILFQLFLVVLLLTLGFVVALVVTMISQDAQLGYYGFLATLYLMIIQMLFGFKNKHTANDNTSGVITVTRILETLPPMLRHNVCVIYFDNEEKGVLGSMFFAKAHPQVAKETLLINFDCVGDGKNIVVLAKKAARKDELYEGFLDSFPCIHRKMKPMMFPSDQMNFQKGIGVCALRKSIFGMYCARIHTPLDTRCRKENVDFLVDAANKFVSNLSSL